MRNFFPGDKLGLKMSKSRGLWTETQMARAMQAVKDGMSERTAAKEFNIPRRTLRNHLRSGSSQNKLGRRSCLTVQQESELCQRIFRLADVGMPLTSKVIRRSVYEFCQKNHIPNPFSNKGIAGRKWLELFLKRHPEVARRKSQFMNPARAAKLNRFIVNDYFEKLKEIMTKLDVLQSPQRIFNIDEKGCRLNLHKSQQVFARKGVKRVHIISQEHAENVSIVGCGNAVGQMIPPMILFKGKRKKEEWLDNLPAGTVIEMTDKGSMTTQVFVKWIHHFAKYKPPGKVLLIFDGASSHLDAGIVDAAESHDISLFCLPSNTTHELQPMDKAVFKAFESYWDDAVMTYWTNKPDRVITKFSFGHIFSKVWPKATNASNVVSGFRATGIYPYNPSAIPDIAFAPSEITEQKLPDNVPSSRPSTSTSVAEQKLSDKVPSPRPSTSTSAATSLRQNKLNSNKRKLSDIDSTSESSDEELSLHDTSSSEEIPDLSTSFNEVLVTPELGTRKINVARKKSLNYRAQEVTKALFNEPEVTPGISDELKQQNETKERRKVFKETQRLNQKANKSVPVSSGVQKNQKKCNGEEKKKNESWYCYLCQEDAMKDMRLCVMCKTYVHEECVGLSSADKETFICPKCN